MDAVIATNNQFYLGGYQSLPDIEMGEDETRGCLYRCSSLLRRIRNCWGSQQDVSDSTQAPAAVSFSNRIGFICNSAISKISSALESIFNNSLFVGLVNTGSVTVGGTAIGLLTPVLKEFTQNCLNELNGLSGQLNDCETPYQGRIILYESMIGVSCGVLGFNLQRIWEISEPRYTLGPSIKDLDHSSLVYKVKKIILRIQREYSYEIHLAAGYLYGGLWLNTVSQSSWNTYYQCGAAAIGIVGGFLGMYARTQWVAAKAQFLNRNSSRLPDTDQFNRRENYLLPAATILVSTGIIGWGSTAESKLQIISREVAMMFLTRPIGKYTAKWIAKRKTEGSYHIRKIASVADIGLRNIQTILVALGYFVYLKSSDLGFRLSGTGMIGLAEGIKDYFYSPYVESNQTLIETSAQDQTPNQIHIKLWRFAKSHWKTAALISILVASTKSRFLDCYDENTYNCPISFEFSGNYISIDSKGINISITAGLVNYYVRRLLRFLIKSKSEWFRHQNSRSISVGYLNLTNKYQFDLLSSIPYAIIQSGSYIAAYDDYATTNPFTPMLFLGFTFGTYKEQVDHDGLDPVYRPTFVDTAVVMPLI